MDNQTPGTNNIDPTALALSRAIRQVESGGNYNAVGDNGTSFGAYQFHNNNFQNWAEQYGLDPNDTSPANQDHLAYARIKDMLDQGIPQSQVAAIWNGAKKVNGQYQAINPDYVNKVQEAYQNQMPNIGLNGVINNQQTNTAVNQPVTQQQNQTQNMETNVPFNAAQQNKQNQPGIISSFQSGKIGQGLLGIAEKALPVGQDIGRDIASLAYGNPVFGSSSLSGKTALQQLGDLGLSALWLTGVGGAAESAGTEAATGAVEEGVGELGTEATTQGVKGLLPTLFQKTLAGAGIGYAGGVAGNLSQGQGLVQSIAPNVNNLAGAAFGGIAPLAGEGLGKLFQKISGIDPQIAAALKDGSITEEQYNSYINAAKTRAGDIRAATPLTMAADNLDQAALKIKGIASGAGEIVGKAKDDLNNIELPDNISSVFEDFKNRIGQQYGIGIDNNGELSTLPGREISVNTATQNKISQIYKSLSDLQGTATKNTGTARQGADVISKLDNLINYRGTDLDPIESLWYSTRQGIDNVLRQVSPDFANANDTFSVIKNVQDEINQMAGNQNQRGELLMKRVFSGDKSGQVQDLFDKIKKITGIDLVNDAVLAKHAIQTVGDQSQKTLLQQIFEEGSKAPTGGGVNIWNWPLAAAKGIAKNTFANPETIGRSLINNGSNSVQGLLPTLFRNAAMRGAATSNTIVNQNQ